MAQPVDTDSIVWDVNPDGSRTPRIRSATPAVDQKLLGNDNAVHCSPDGGLWVEPQPLDPEAGSEMRTYPDTEPGVVYPVIENFSNPDAYDKSIMLTLCAVIHDVNTGDPGGTHVVRVTLDDDGGEVVRQAMPYSPGSDRLVPSIVSTVIMVPLPAGSGANEDASAAAGVPLSTEFHPDAPPILRIRFAHVWEARPGIVGPYGRNELVWSWLIA